jgi:hypothetical protein
MDLSGGGYMDVNLSPGATPETISALRALGEAALNRMEAPVDLIGKKATIVGYSETGDDREDLGFVAHVCLDIEDGRRVFFQATEPKSTWRIVVEPRAANSQPQTLEES